MKRIIAAFAALILLSVSGFAQTDKKPHGDNGWEEIKAEKVGFITDKLDLSVEEAQVFWPVYNKYEKEFAAANKEVRKALRGLHPKKDEKVSEAEMAQRLNVYVAAKSKVSDITAAYNKEFLKVLPASKVAKLYLAEEQFMHKMLDRFAQKKYRKPSVEIPRQPVKPKAPAKKDNQTDDVVE